VPDPTSRKYGACTCIGPLGASGSLGFAVGSEWRLKASVDFRFVTTLITSLGGFRFPSSRQTGVATIGIPSIRIIAVSSLSNIRVKLEQERLSSLHATQEIPAFTRTTDDQVRRSPTMPEHFSDKAIRPNGSFPDSRRCGRRTKPVETAVFTYLLATISTVDRMYLPYFGLKHSPEHSGQL
jgi:hypothetical protein